MTQRKAIKLAIALGAFALLPNKSYGFGLGGQISLLFSCLSAAGFQVQVPSNPHFMYEADLVSTKYSSVGTDASGQAQYTPVHGIEDIVVEKGLFNRMMFYNNLRFFPASAGSFNIAVGAGIASTAVSMGLATKDGSERYAEKSTVNSILNGFSIGNMWRKKEFYFGVDWVGGIYVRRYNLVTKGSIAEKNTTFGKAREEFYQDDGKCVTKGGATLLSMVFGLYI